jgi:hypothetical protein
MQVLHLKLQPWWWIHHSLSDAQKVEHIDGAKLRRSGGTGNWFGQVMNRGFFGTRSDPDLGWRSTRNCLWE